MNVVLNLFQRNILGAASSVIEGINVEGDLEFVNNSFVPLYLPETQNHVYVENIQTQSVISTKQMWIPPHNSYKQPFNILIAKSDIPNIALQSLAKGGQIDVKIESQFTLGTFTITKNTNKQENIVGSLSSYVDDATANNATINSYNWSPRTISIGNSAMISISLSGGTAGNYSLEVMKDISLGEDQTITSFSINYTSSTTSKSFSFTPSSGGSYYVHLIHQGNTVWSQPNDSSRLTVQSRSLGHQSN